MRAIVEGFTDRRRLVRAVGSIATVALAFTYLSGALVPHEIAGAPVKVVRFEFQPALGDTARGDALADSASWDYADYRIASGTAPVCVEAEGGPTALGFHILNRKMNEAGTRCGELGGTVRQYVVDVADSVACQELASYDPDYVVLNSDGSCHLNGADNPRIRVANLWANKLPATTPIAFLISSFNPPYPEHGGFEIKSSSAASVTGTSAVRAVRYDGTASLVKFVIGEKTKAVGGTFPLRLTMVFERVTP